MKMKSSGRKMSRAKLAYLFLSLLLILWSAFNGYLEPDKALSSHWFELPYFYGMLISFPLSLIWAEANGLVFDLFNPSGVLSKILYAIGAFGFYIIGYVMWFKLIPCIIRFIRNQENKYNF